jgi:hypothetical protein
VTPLGPPDIHWVLAAEGWLGLGDVAEAKAELLRVSEAHRQHPAVLDTLWSVHAAERDWASAFVVASQLVEVHPGLVAGWIHRAYAARRMPGGGLAAALEALRPAAARFPSEAMIPYNLACYLAQSGAEEEAWGWYCQAAVLGKTGKVRELALQDEDLKPLWARIRGMGK